MRFVWAFDDVDFMLQELKVRREPEENWAERRNSQSTADSEHSSAPDPVNHVRENPVNHTRENPVNHTRENPVNHVRENPVNHTRENPVNHVRENPVNHTRENPVNHVKENPLAKFFPGLETSVSLPGLGPGALTPEAMSQHMMMMMKMPNAGMFMPGVYGQPPVFSTEQTLLPAQEAPSDQSQVSITADTQVTENIAQQTTFPNHHDSGGVPLPHIETRTVSRKSRATKTTNKLPDVNSNYDSKSVDSSSDKAYSQENDAAGRPIEHVHANHVTEPADVAVKTTEHQQWNNSEETGDNWNSPAENWDQSGLVDHSNPLLQQQQKIQAQQIQQQQQQPQKFQQQQDMQQQQIQQQQQQQQGGESQYYAMPLGNPYPQGSNPVLSEPAPTTQVVTATRRPLPVLHSSIATVLVNVVQPGVPKGYSFVPGKNIPHNVQPGVPKGYSFVPGKNIPHNVFYYLTCNVPGYTPKCIQAVPMNT